MIIIEKSLKIFKEMLSKKDSNLQPTASEAVALHYAIGQFVASPGFEPGLPESKSGVVVHYTIRQFAVLVGLEPTNLLRHQIQSLSCLTNSITGQYVNHEGLEPSTFRFKI